MSRKKRTAAGSPGPRHGPPILPIVLLISFAAIVFYFIAESQRRNAEAHRLRLLAGLAERIESTVEELGNRFLRIVELSPREQPEEDGGESPIEQRVKWIDNLRTVAPRAVPREDGEHRPRLDLAEEGSRIYLTYVRDEGDARPAVTGEIDLGGVARPIIVPDVFDSLLIATREGKVLVRAGDRKLRLTDIAPLVAPKEGEGEDAMPLNFATRVEERRIADDDYLVFLQPITIRLQGLEGNGGPTSLEWVACGIVSWENLLSTSITGSPFLLLLLLSLFPLGLISWPFFKLGLMSRRQRFRRTDVAALVLATLLGVSLLSLLVLDLRFFFRFRHTVDRQLEELSERIESNLQRDLVEAHLQLRQLNDPRLIDGLWDLRPRDQELEGGRWRLTGPPRSRPGALTELSLDFPLETFESVAWIDRAGEQRAKLPRVENALLKNNVGDRGYFRCAREAELWTLAPDDGVLIELAARPASDRRWLSLAPLVASPAGNGSSSNGTHPGSNGTHPSSTTIRFCLESIRSRTTGRELAALSIDRATLLDDAGRYDRRLSEEQRKELAAAVIVFHPSSIAEPALAPGFAFAVVDSGGRVLFHSDPRRNLTESFLKASDEDPVLASMIDKRRRGHVGFSYWGRGQRAFVQPLEPLPWSLVTFRGTRDLRLRNFELIYDFLNPFLLYALILGLAAAAVLAFRRRALDALWPDAALSGSLYRRIVLGAMCAMAGFSLVLALGSQVSVFYLSALLPIGAAAVFACDYIALRSRGSDGGRGAAKRKIGPFFSLAEAITAPLALLASLAAAVVRREPILVFLAVAVLVLFSLRCRKWFYFFGRRRRKAYVFALTSMLFLLGVLPAVGFFEVALERQYQLIVQDAQLGMAEALDRRSPDGSGSADYLQSFFDSALADAPVRGPECRGRPAWAANGSRGSLMRRILSSRMVPVNDLSLSPVGIDLSRFDRDEGTWRAGKECLAAELPKADGGGVSWHLSSSITEIHFSSWDRTVPGALSFLALAVLLAAPWLLARVIAEKVLLISLVETEEKGNIRDLLKLNGADGAPRRIFLVTGVPGLAEEGLEVALGEEKGYALRSFAEIRDGSAGRRGLLRGFARGEVDDAETLVVTGFRPDLSAPAAVTRQIEVLEKTLGRGKGRAKRLVIILAKKDPASGPADADAAEGKVDPEARRIWNSFLASFIVRYGRDAGDRERLEKAIESRRSQLEHPRHGFLTMLAGLARRFRRNDEAPLREEADDGDPATPAPDDPGGGVTPDVEELLATVRRECRHTRQLQRIGRQVIEEVEHASTVEGLVSKIGYLARSYYQAIWDSCNTDERVVLVQLARDGVANPKSYDSILDLIQRGLVVKAPGLRLMNESFARFVRQRVERSQELRWQEEEGTSAWSVLKWLLPLPLLFLGGFLFVTQRDAFSNVVGFVLALGSVAPTLVNLFGYFQQGSARSRDKAREEVSGEV